MNMAQIFAAVYFALLFCPQEPASPKSLPDQWKGRRQIEIASAYLYASDRSAAKEEEKRLNSLLELLKENSISPRGKGILILSCPKDSVSLEDIKKLISP